MRNQEGITLITLIVTIIILMILTTITIYNSIDMYFQMHFENYIVQLEELQSAVDKMCEKYKTDGYTSYSDPENGFFIKKYGKIPGTLALAENKQKAINIISKYFGNKSDFHDGFVFYFSSNEIEDYFNINGIDFDIVVDFSTRYVYSVDGEKESEDDDIVYSLIDIDSSYIIQQSSGSILSDSTGITFTQTNLPSENPSMCKITLVLNYKNAIGKYNIKKAYYSKNGGENWIEVDYLGDCKYTTNTVSFYIYDPGTYLFKVQDTSGKMITNIQGSTDSVYTTINF